MRNKGDCRAIALDITGFFDHIDHLCLRRNLVDVLAVGTIPDPDFRIFKRMTQFEWVDSDALRIRLGNLYGQRGRICTSEQFRNIVRCKSGNLVNKNKKSCGIPQGTPLSGLYANISMIEFDRQMVSILNNIGGSYRRYSDDIAIIMPCEHDYNDLIALVRSKLSDIGLSLSEGKTEVSQFRRNEQNVSTDRRFQYLGFTFDGGKILIRPSSISRYHKKMRAGVKAKIRAAKIQGIAKDSIYMRELFKRYTHFGRQRNFPQYAYRAAKVLNSPNIRWQMRGHMAAFKEAIRYYTARAYE
ncbi:reverse transcriptase domain-containing protein [Novosphingobium sp. NRRL B-2648]|uniref:reverse transcriptase domain-containing protein n=1 Tax=Novosphingobium TaxID=165696 RepID=UPI00351728BC